MIQSLFPHLRQQMQSWFTKAQNVTQSDNDFIELPDTLLIAPSQATLR